MRQFIDEHESLNVPFTSSTGTERKAENDFDDGIRRSNVVERGESSTLRYGGAAGAVHRSRK